MLLRTLVLAAAVLLQTLLAGAISSDEYGSSLRSRLDEMMADEKPREVLQLLGSIESTHGTLLVDSDLPSLYTYKGVAFFELNRMADAVLAFRSAVAAYPKELRAWMNLAQALAGAGQDFYDVSRMVEQLSGKPFIVDRFENAMWRDIELHMHRHELDVRRCLQTRDPKLCDNNALLLNMFSSDDVGFVRRVSELFWDLSFPRGVNASNAWPPHDSSTGILTVGIMLSCVEPGPVQILAHGFFERLSKYRHIRVVGLLLSTVRHDSQRWMANFTNHFHEIVFLENLSFEEGAQEVRRRKIDVLVEMNGVSVRTGLGVMSYRPAPVQISFLGDPYTVGSPQIDHFVGDPISSPPELAGAAFTERLLLLPTSYLVSSHAVWQPQVLRAPCASRSELATYLEPSSVPFGTASRWEKRVLLGSFHGCSKVDPVVFHLWMNILHAVPQGYLVLASNRGAAAKSQNRANQARFYGQNDAQVGYLPSLPWDRHLHVKSAIDLFMDTLGKNGHSTTVDAAFAGIPIVGLGSKYSMHSRSTASLTHYLGSAHGIVPSLKAYEDTVIDITKRRRNVLEAWRRETNARRARTTIFDIDFQSAELVNMFEASVELAHLSNCTAHVWTFCTHLRTRPAPYPQSGGTSHFHVFAAHARAP